MNVIADEQYGFAIRPCSETDTPWGYSSRTFPNIPSAAAALAEFMIGSEDHGVILDGMIYKISDDQL